ncbi:MAG: hypothetical protein QXD34_05560 [Candidatus Bathyarchaeia archaeon]|nr:hypothetical protein [Candidatus Bathyarchaeota archaeon]
MLEGKSAIDGFSVVSAGGASLKSGRLVKVAKLLRSAKTLWRRGCSGGFSPRKSDLNFAPSAGPAFDSVLAKIKREAMRRKVWFRLSKVERALVDLTLKCVKQPRSPRLIDVLASIIVKVKAFLAGQLQWLMGQVGKPLAMKLSKIAESWGNKEARKWAEDVSFIRFLTVMDKTFQSLAWRH